LQRQGVSNYIQSAHRGFSARWREQSGEHLYRGGLPRAVRTEERADGSWLYFKRDAVHRREGAEPAHQGTAGNHARTAEYRSTMHDALSGPPFVRAALTSACAASSSGWAVMSGG